MLILGKNGQVGSALLKIYPGATSLGRAELDLSQPDQMERVLADQVDLNSLDCIINAAAYTAVDKAESESGLAHRINFEAVEKLAEIAARYNILLVHYSTDYVFSGESTKPYVEDAPTSPTGVYGHSKLKGEQAIIRQCERYLIFRTSWVFAEQGSNFVNTMLRLAGERDSLGVVHDQFGCPTYAGDIADLTQCAITQVLGSTGLAYGLYHLCCDGRVSWHEFAVDIISRAKEAGLIHSLPETHSLTTAEYPTAAQRPANSVLNTIKLQQALGRSMPHWSRGLGQLLASRRH